MVVVNKIRNNQGSLKSPDLGGANRVGRGANQFGEANALLPTCFTFE